MSAIASDRADTAKGRLRPMREDDLEAVMEIEHRAYPFPWTHGIFRDCLRADYPAWILHEDGRILGYGVLSVRSEEHTSELQSLMRISYAVFCLKKKKLTTNEHK